MGSENRPLRMLDGETLRSMVARHVLHTETHGEEGKEIDLAYCVINGYDFSGLGLSSLQAQGTIFNDCRFVGTDLFYANFSNASARGTDFQSALLAKAEIWSSDLSGASFTGANLLRADFIECELQETVFHGANLSGASFSECSLTAADFHDCDLAATGFSDCNLLGTRVDQPVITF